jgi:hypothetical protein
MTFDKYSYRFRCAAALLAFAAAAFPLCAVDNEDFNWTEAAQFVDNLPFPQKFMDSLAAACKVTAPSPPLRRLPPQSFSKGEMLVYDIGWSFIKGGYVILTATPDPARRTIRLGAKALSRGFVSTFYRMRDYAIATVDAEGLYPLSFEEHLREGKHYKADKWFLYDPAGEKLHLKDRTLSVPAFTADYISLLYLARTRKFVPGDTFCLPFFVDGKLYNLVFSCSKRATMEFNGKKVMCLVTQPQPADDKGEFNKKKRLEIWFSDDEDKLPLRIKAKIAIGSIVADLIYAGRPKSAVVKSLPENTTKTPQPAKKTADTSKPLTSTAAQKDSYGTAAGDTVITEPHDLRKAQDSIESAVPQKDSGRAFAADTTAIPTPPISKTFYETIEVKDAGELPSGTPEGNGTGPCGEPAPPACSRDNSY